MFKGNRDDIDSCARHMSLIIYALLVAPCLSFNIFNIYSTHEVKFNIILEWLIH